MKKQYIYYILFCLIVVSGVIVSILADNVVLESISIIATLAGVLGLLFSFKLDRDLNASSFLVNLYNTFRGNKEIQKLSRKLDDKYLNKPVTIDESDRHSLIEYLTFFEVLGSLERRGVITINVFDSLFGYDFFVAANDKDVQNLELITHKSYYYEIHRLYPRWAKFRKKHKLPIPFEESKLLQDKK